MVFAAISGALLGAVFGLRFKVLVLVPAILFGMLVVVAAGLAQGTAHSAIGINAVVWACSLQFGYIGGLFTRFAMVTARVRLMPRSGSLARAPH